MSKLRRLFAMFLAIAALPAGLLAQERGTIAGRVTDQATGQPMAGVQVTVQATGQRVVTDAQGQYRITGVPAGRHPVSAALIGREGATQQVTVTAGGTATANFALAPSAIGLEGLVVTATGREQRQREIGSSVSTINTEQVNLAPVTDFSQLVQGRTAGTVVLQNSGTTGTGSRIRIRGNNSISLSNAPLLIIDGVRVESESGSLGTFGLGGQGVSRFNDLNPEDIESVEILKGPAASALYGTAAANGVIQVTTKRGRAGAPQFRVWTEYGRIEETTDFPDNVFSVGTLFQRDPRSGQVVSAGTGRCDLSRLAVGNNPGRGEVGCTGITETFRFNPLENSASRPFQDGNRRTVGGSVSGGGEEATFYVSGEVTDEDGVLPQNTLRRYNIQTNLTGNFGPKLNISGKVGFTESDLELPLGDNALFGLVPLAIFGSPTPQAVEATGGFEADPKFFYDWQNFQALSRFTGSARADYRPIPWLSLNGTVGLDRLSREDVNRLPRETAYRVFGGVYTNGFIQNFDFDIYNLTTNGSGTAIFNLSPDLISTTSLGTQFIRESNHRVYAFGANLTPGVETSLAGATADFDAGESNVLNATLSGYAQQQFAWRDRVFLNAAVRGDQNTAFGSDIGWTWYPALSGSWVISEEPFFPQTNFLTNFRLRAAYGQSGLRPGPTDALQSFSGAVGVFANRDQPAIIINEIGNPDLRPERVTELEAGFESGFFDDRLGLEVTYFNKRSTDALVSRPLPPSAGASASRFENIGEVRNSGLELLLSGQAVRRRNFEWNFNLTGSFIQNELLDLGLDAQGNPIPPIVLGSQRHAEGFPLGSYFQYPILSADDKDGNGLLSPSEVVIGDSVQFMGNPFPSREFSFNSDVTLFNWLRVSALFDYKGGHEILNFTRAWRCVDKSNCEAAFDTNTSLEEQAAFLGRRSARRTYAGFVEPADFLKFRELAFTLSVPQSLANRFGSNGLSVTLAGRNLATWTDYTGFDPEVNYAGQANFTTGDFATLPPNRLLTIRLDANF